MIRVLVIASSAVARAGLEALLREEPRFAVVSSSSAGPSGTRAPDAQADVLLVEIAPANHIASRRTLHQDDVAATVLLADQLTRAELRRALHSGVRAILPRDATGPEIIAAIQAAAVGLTVLSSEEMDALLPLRVEAEDEVIVADETLSVRELEVLGMLAEGLGNKDIGARLKISEHTVKFHVSSILGKLRAATRGEAVARGVREGLIAI